MNIDELYQYAYLKRPLNEIYQDPILVPKEFLLDWFKDEYDYQRPHSDEELRQSMALTPEQILTWLEEAAALLWETKNNWLKDGRRKE